MTFFRATWPSKIQYESRKHNMQHAWCFITVIIHFISGIVCICNKFHENVMNINYLNNEKHLVGQMGNTGAAAVYSNITV